MITNATTRTLRMVEIMASHVLEGISNGELASLLKTHKANVSRDLTSLEASGWAHKLDNGRWALTPKPLAIARAYGQAVESSQLRMTELQQRIEARSLDYLK